MYVYILKLSNDKHYTGITNSLKRRFKEHNAGRSKSTRRHLPFIVIWVYKVENRKKARRLEVHIKKRGAARFYSGLSLSEKKEGKYFI